MIGHLIWEIQKINLFYCYPQIHYQQQYLSYFEFLLQNLLCATDYVVNNKVTCVFQLLSMR